MALGLTFLGISKLGKGHSVTDTDKGPYNQSYVFSNSNTWCESWTIKKAERQRIDAFCGARVDS